MISLGFVTLDEQQERGYCTEVAKRAGRCGISVCRFSPLNIDPQTEYVHGSIFQAETSEWTDAVFAIPPFLYDRCFYGHDDRSKKAKPIMHWLKQRPDLVFLGYGLPGKWEVYESLSSHPLLSAYVPPTIRLERADDMLELLRDEHAVVAKPVHGSGGRGIYVIQKQGKTLSVQDGLGQERTVIARRKELERLITSLNRRDGYALQPLLPLSTPAREPFDLRFLLQKDETGRWIERVRAVRIGRPGTWVANVRAGADIRPFADWLDHLPSPKRILVVDGIETIIRTLPTYIDSEFGPLFEIGLDLGVADNGAVWILDVNSKPGRKVISILPPEQQNDIYEAPLRYCLFLASEVNHR
ncbi:YheC/YheD family endospore coat-associated protein [Geobacillus subterraneus]|uniref:YheC/YheD family endospore coat-associated protein n=1 Tax=Geobacillus subterraneus TaxID=129338 RepID=UPI00161C392A